MFDWNQEGKRIVKPRNSDIGMWNPYRKAFDRKKVPYKFCLFFSFSSYWYARWEKDSPFYELFLRSVFRNYLTLFEINNGRVKQAPYKAATLKVLFFFHNIEN